MLLDAFLAIVHHLAVFSLFALLAVQVTMLSAPLSVDRLRLLGRMDAAYGLAALITLAAGGLRAALGAKGWGFYSANPLFWSKLGLFAAIGLISIVPTLRYLRWRKANVPVDDAQRRSCINLVIAQLTALFLLPVLAALMARDIGQGA